MEFDTPDGDSRNRTKCGGSGISGMGSVIATVSGYHGTERFRLIKLISETGASYVGALSISTTHLVCWELKGKKFDLANSLGIKVISHQWFEDCLKEGRCVPEDPYTMKCGKHVSPLSWKVPDASLDGKKYEVSLGKSKILHDRSNTFRCHGNFEICSHSSDVKHLERSHPYLRKSCPLSSMACTKGKSLICDGAGTSNKSLSVRRKHRIKRNAYFDSSYHVGTSCEERCFPIESHDPVKDIAQDSVATVNMTNMEESFDARVNITRELTDIANLSDEMTLSSSKTQSLNMECMNHMKDQFRRIEEHRNTKYLETDASSCCSNNLYGTELPIGKPLLLNGNCSSVERGKNEKEGADNMGELNILIDLSCVICLTSFSSTRGVLPCGHRFCYSCIKAWADIVASNKKIPTCPLCKTNFTSIMKVEGAASCDQKIFSQTIPEIASNMNFFICPDRGEETTTISPRESICSECRHYEPEDLLLNCHVCTDQWVHSCCLDPPLVPWTCVHCRDLRMLYQLYR